MDRIRPKDLDALLKDDPSLKEKITYEEYQAGKSVPGNSDYQIEDVYKDYISFLKKGTIE